MADSKKQIFKIVNSQKSFVKISQIGPWVYRIDWCKGHWCGSTYMAMRLSDISSKTAKKHKKGPIFEILAGKNLENWRFWKTQLFSVIHFSNNFFFCFIPMKISPNLYGRKEGSKFWWFPWFPENSLLCVILRCTVYI